MNSHNVRRTVVIGGLLLAALTACGSESQGNQPAQPTGGGVATRDLPGVGTVLVDNAGKTLYFTDSDMPGAIKCTAECNSVWIPAAAPSGVTLGANMGTVQRPDGTSQLTYQSKPLYTFTLDTKEKPSFGNNQTDSFAGTDFTWHAVIVSASNQPAPTSDTGYDRGGGGGY